MAVNPIVTLEEHVDDLLQAIYLFALATLSGMISAFALLPERAAGAVFDMAGQFFSYGGSTDPTVITWAGALAVIAGGAIYVTNLGIEALYTKPFDIEMDEFVAALLVVVVPVVLIFDVGGVATDYATGTFGPVALTLTPTAIAFWLSEQDND